MLAFSQYTLKKVEKAQRHIYSMHVAMQSLPARVTLVTAGRLVHLCCSHTNCTLLFVKSATPGTAQGRA